MSTALKEAQKKWSLTEAFAKSLYGALDRTPKHQWTGLRVADELGEVTIKRYERTKNGLNGRVWLAKEGKEEEVLVDKVRALAGKWKVIQ